MSRSANYASRERLPGVTGSQIQRQIATLKARLIARYRLSAVPGRPEELGKLIPTSSGPIDLTKDVEVERRLVSVGYGCGTIRIRKHGGKRNRKWVETLDIQPDDGWHAKVYDFLDPFLLGPGWSGNQPVSSPEADPSESEPSYYDLPHR